MSGKSRALTERFWRNVGWQYLATFSDVLVRFAVSVVVARGLGKYDYGLIAASTAFASIAAQIFQGRLIETVVKFGAELRAGGDKEKIRTFIFGAFLFELVNALLVFCLVLLGVEIFGSLISDEARYGDVVTLRGLAFLFIGMGSVTCTGYLRVAGRIRLYSIVIVSCSVVNLITMTLLVEYFELGIYAVACAMAAISGLRTILLAVSCFADLGLGIQSLSLVALKNFFGFSGLRGFLVRNHMTGLVGLPSKDLDLAILGGFVGLETVGAYRLAKNLMGTLWLVGDPFLALVLPEITNKVAAKAFSELRGFLRALTQLLMISGFGILLVSYTGYPILIEFVFAKEYSSSNSIFFCMGWAILFWLPLLWLHPLILAFGRADLSLRAAVYSCFISLGLFGLLIPPFGAYGAAIAFATGHASTVVTRAYLALKDSDIRTALTGS